MSNYVKQLMKSKDPYAAGLLTYSQFEYLPKLLSFPKGEKQAQWR